MTFTQTANLTKQLITLLQIDESSKEGLMKGVMSLELDYGLEQIAAQQARKLLQSCETELEQRGKLMTVILNQKNELLEALQSLDAYWKAGNFSRDEQLWEKITNAIKKATT